MDSTFIEAPSPTKNKKKERDPEAHSTKKGKTWHFGYKAHIGTDRESGLVHHVKTTAANDHDVTAVSDLMHGEEDTIHGDSAYIGAQKRPEAITRNKKGKKIKYLICRKPSSLKKLSKSGQYAAKKSEHKKSSVRCKVEHVFAVIKKLFGYRKLDTEVCESRLLKIISCSHWQICIWLTGNPCRSDSVRLCAIIGHKSMLSAFLPGVFLYPVLNNGIYAVLPLMCLPMAGCIRIPNNFSRTRKDM